MLDVGALRHMATGSSIYARVALATANERGYALVVPAAVLAATRAAATPAVAARLHVFGDIGAVLQIELSPPDAETVGALLATTADTLGADLAAGHAVLCGMRRHQRVITDRPDVLRHIAPDVEIDELP